MERILITQELAEWLNSKPVLSSIQIGYTLTIRDLSGLSIKDESNLTHNKYMVVANNGYGYPIDCGEEQISQLLELIIEDMKQRENES
jgi:hypothetical protein